LLALFGRIPTARNFLYHTPIRNFKGRSIKRQTAILTAADRRAAGSDPADCAVKLFRTLAKIDPDSNQLYNKVAAPHFVPLSS